MILVSLALAATAPTGSHQIGRAAGEKMQVMRTCPETAMSLARKLGEGGPRALPLGMLPQARAYMAVDRRVDGCPAPLTMVSYRRTTAR